MTDNDFTEEKLLAEMKRNWEDNFQFYSNAGKEARERWVVSEFLSCLFISFTPEELRSQEQKSKIDVEFREGRFQIKEITDPDIRRNAEIKTTYERVMNAKTLQKTVGPGFACDIPSIVSGYDLVKERARDLALSEKYVECKSNLDLLFYVTRSRASIIKPFEINREELSSLGWRSISCLMGRDAMVLYASCQAPIFLREVA